MDIVTKITSTRDQLLAAHARTDLLQTDIGVLHSDLVGTRLALDERVAEAERRERIMMRVVAVVFKDEIDMGDEEAVRGRLKKY